MRHIEHDESGYPWMVSLLCILPTLAFVAAVWWIFRTEIAVEAYFDEYRDARPLYTEVVEHITDYGNFLYNIPFVYLLIRGLRNRGANDLRVAASYAAALAITMIIVYFMKEGVGRARPFVDEYGYLPWGWEHDYDSFPSGHTSQAMAAVVTLAVFIRRRRWAPALGLLGAVVPATRILLGAHFMTDVLGGIVMGVFCSFLAWHILRRLEQRGWGPGTAETIKISPPSPPPPLRRQ